MHDADPDRCIRQRGKTSGLIGLECSEKIFDKNVLKRCFENAVTGRGNLRRPQFYFYVLRGCLAFCALRSRLTFRVLSSFLAFC